MQERKPLKLPFSKSLRVADFQVPVTAIKYTNIEKASTQNEIIVLNWFLRENRHT
jgi:hypothetical protein